MKQIMSFTILVLLINIATLSQNKTKVNTIELENQIDSLMMPLVIDKLTSGTILIAINDAIVVHKAYGMANIEDGILNTIDTKFPIASITKMFTAISILQLYERGLLDLKDNLNKYIPDFPKGDKITIYNLLTHTSGIPSYNSVKEENATFNELIGKIKELERKFEPGEDVDYSNSGMVLLTYIIEKVSELPYEEFVKENIFKPCKMHQSGILPSDSLTIINNLANGYTFDETGRIQRAKRAKQGGKGAGALYSTTFDMYKFSKVLFNETLISSKTLEVMFNQFKQINDQPFALGCFVQNYNGWKVVWHDGGIVGIRTLFKVYIKPDSKVTVIYLFNTDFMLSNYIGDQIGKIAISEPWRPVFYKDQKLIDSFEKYIGTYEIASDDTFKITIKNDQLFYQENNQKKYAALPFSESSLFIKELNARIHFAEDRKTGKVTFTGYFGTSVSAFMVNGNRIKK
ncbi:MAG: beta-lactamase family protein [Methanosarcinaceae archaeon]|nr:beta-lactamase family protein [Methanosarcinaceae archaeon]